MKRLRLLLVLCLLPACAPLFGSGRGGDDPARMRLWHGAYDAMARDSFRVAEAQFQRLTNEFPRTREGHEARFYLGYLALEPRRGVNLAAAEQNLSLYLSQDSAWEMRGYHRPEAEGLLLLVRELGKPCGDRAPGLPCEVQTQTRIVTRPGETPPAPSGGDASAAEAARLRRQLEERDETIRTLREELERIRNTLTPRRPR